MFHRTVVEWGQSDSLGDKGLIWIFHTHAMSHAAA